MDTTQFEFDNWADDLMNTNDTPPIEQPTTNDPIDKPIEYKTLTHTEVTSKLRELCNARGEINIDELTDVTFEGMILYWDDPTLDDDLC